MALIATFTHRYGAARYSSHVSMRSGVDVLVRIVHATQ